MASEHQFLYGAAALSIAVLYILCRALFDPLRTIPGPFITRFTRGWYFLKLWNEDFEKTNIDIHRRYGKVVRIAPNEYSIDDPSAVKTIYGLGSQFPKAEWYWGFANPFQIFETIFTTRDVSYHNSMRRAAQNHYQMSTLVGYEGYVDDCGQLLTMRLEEISEAGISANLGEWLQKYAFDVIGEITFGNRFGFLDSGEDIGGLIGALEKRRVFSSLSGIYPFWHKLACHIMSKIPGSGAAGFLYLNRFGSEKIEQRKAEVKANPNLEVGPVPQVDRFLKAHMERPDSYPTHAIYLGCMANILAGSDTTGISLAAIVNNLCRHPESLQKLRAEIDNAAAEGRLSDPVVFKETQSMLYLNAVIKESLRLHPAVGLPLARKVPKGGASISGHFMPEGTTVGISCWVAHYNTSVFGSNAHVFCPERWLDEEPSKLAAMEQYNFPFGLGSRNCLGKNISLLEINKVIPQLVRHFDFRLGRPNEELKSSNFWFVKQQGFTCKVSRRKTF